jgi:DNA (cytosine-5)-methyltransferase 1
MDDYVAMESGLVIPKHVGEAMALAGCRPKAVDLFCGCGGFSLGFMQAGYEVVAAVDNCPDAAITYTMNLGKHPMQFVFVEESDRQGLEKRLTKKYKKAARHQVDAFETSGSGWISTHPKVPGVGVFFLGDICKIKGRDILDAIGLEVGELDAVIGSPPCQGFSFANAGRSVDDPRNQLIFEYARLVCEMRPVSLCMENVPGIQSMRTPDGFLVLDLFCQILEDGGFAGVDAMRAAVKQRLGVTVMRSRQSKKTSRARRRPGGVSATAGLQNGTFNKSNRRAE